ncbi:MAG: SUF system NifU family Fe-S cluster assembly protein [Nitrospinae bacterium RIFCSPLOWO2_02_FULL_39_110]|nr:MAG: SUF system NifU family Fe-S cluster assembly protein [Nitrospinae bacterium RIFCSPHIGHO2_12_FULL_39_42]OGW01815.1 MAG: SUF system NifU family Fe-S cluster assembly protein [Nitrospinae bacterium RIFCSPLOWO2_02_39_17]OGW02912.1 MAG: SUF system NifU family Fe-S cluster assembly protein [Nitrospinae bacterium RIFCSPHIGHO2_02_FULL_39_82]OGW07495.1 MAG: SUF system NifU family Fe-S cluster assembly protein [Nitrospinae bacterium RIFCSPLOWO2_02_FULL_39_110]OGW07776.1 MAG: SUF system NifU famil
MSYQSELYQQVILDHNKKPRNFRPLENPTHSCDGHNPLCGDEITIYLKLNKDMMVEEISFSGSGCAISKASASLMTTHVKGKSVEEVKIMFDEFHRMIRGEFDPDKNKHHLGRLTIFIGVREFPSRTKCASLAWHTLICALDRKGEAYTE